MASQNDVALLRSGYEAFSKGDMETVSKVFDPAIRWHVSGRSQISGTYEGQESVFAFFGRLVELTGGTFNVEIHDLLGSDDHVVALVSETATRNGKDIQSDEVHVWHVKDGRAVEFWGIPSDPYKVDEFWG